MGPTSYLPTLKLHSVGLGLWERRHGTMVSGELRQRGRGPRGRDLDTWHRLYNTASLGPVQTPATLRGRKIKAVVLVAGSASGSAGSHSGDEVQVPRATCPVHVRQLRASTCVCVGTTLRRNTRRGERGRVRIGQGVAAGLWRAALFQMLREPISERHGGMRDGYLVYKLQLGTGGRRRGQNSKPMRALDVMVKSGLRSPPTHA